MPSSGYPIESIFNRFGDAVLNKNDIEVTEKCAKWAIKNGMFAEWLESFVGAYNHMKANGVYTSRRAKKPTKGVKPDVIECAYAGIEEWDL